LFAWEHVIKKRVANSVDDEVYKGAENDASGSSLSGFVTFMLRVLHLNVSAGRVASPSG
jgi:hypothetical protein